MAGEPIHPHARIHQVNPQRRCGHRRGLVAFERIRALSLVVSDPRRNFADPVEQVSHIAEDVTQIYQPGAAGLCRKESF
jgi:hypothetical protein